MKCFFLIIFLFSFCYSDILTSDQKKIVKIVKQTSSKFKEEKDISVSLYSDIMVAICFAESDAGRISISDRKKGDPITKASLGVMQVRLETVRDMSLVYKELSYLKSWSDTKIAEELLHNPAFSVKVANHYFLYNQKRFKSPLIAISMHNGGVRNYPYVKGVFSNFLLVKRLQARGEIS